MVRKTVTIQQPMLTQSSNKTQSQIKAQSKPKIKQLKPEVVAAKERALVWRDHLRTRRMSPIIRVNNTRRRTNEGNVAYAKRKARKYARENFGLNL